MNKNTPKALVLCMLISLLTGCFPSGELKTSSEPVTNSANNATSSENSDNSESSAPAAPAVPQDLEHVKFNIELDSEYPTELPVVKAKLATFDFEEVKPIFLGDKNVTAEGNGIYYTDDGITFIVRDDQIDYWASHRYGNDEEKQLIYTIQTAAVNNLSQNYMNYPSINSELEGFPRSEALERANELVEKVGLKYFGEPTVYTFISEEVEVNLAGKITAYKDGGDILEIHLPKENEFYYIKYPTTFNDITAPETNDTIYGGTHQALSFVKIILTKDELVDFSCIGVYEEIEVVDTIPIKCSAESALSKLYDYYLHRENEGNMKERYEYNSLDLAYITFDENYDTGEITYKPLWCAEGTVYDLDGTRLANSGDKYIDPATGFVFG